jgi:hypothetical protein
MPVVMALAMAVPAVLYAQAAETAPTLKPFDKAEVLDVENNVWDPCTVIAVYKGAYQVSCTYTKSLRRDIHVRKAGGEAAAQTAAQAVTGPPFKRDDIVLASPLSLPDKWKLCIVERNGLAATNSYALECGGTKYNVGPDWVRTDPEAPQ